MANKKQSKKQRKEIFLESHEGENTINEGVSWVIIMACIILSLIFKHTILGLFGLFLFWFRHIKIIVEEKSGR